MPQGSTWRAAAPRHRRLRRQRASGRPARTPIPCTGASRRMGSQGPSSEHRASASTTTSVTPRRRGWRERLGAPRVKLHRGHVRAGGGEHGGLAAGRGAEVEHAHARRRTGALGDEPAARAIGTTAPLVNGRRAAEVDRAVHAQAARLLSRWPSARRRAARPPPRPRRRAGGSATARRPGAGWRRRRARARARAHRPRTRSRRSSRGASGAALPPRAPPPAARRTTPGPRRRCAAGRRS